MALGAAGEEARRALGRRRAEPQPGAEPGRGRDADTPTTIPRPGWKDIAWRTVKEVGADDLATVARSIAFSGMLALFPALAAFVSVYGLFADVGTAREHLAGLTGLVPAAAMTLIGDQMVRLAQASEANLSLAFVFGLALSLWSANAGVKALFKGLNVAYEETETRGFIRLNLVSLAFTLGTVLLLALAMAALVALPVALELLRVDPGLVGLSQLRWPALLGVVTVFLSLLYRYGPSRAAPKWRWVTPGGLAAAVLWMAGSALFSWYLTRFADYDATYGSLGAVFGFMTWLWLSSTIVLVGAELNAEIEHQTARDSTTGPEQPLGTRGATMADTVGEVKRGSLLPKWPGRRR
ncbi:MAG: YihY/virulence factor BrkB family protein [Proteobacteria bacterium]|nr:YihY/virulence factor BrkB family protein [Pseudomonadota bacterium]